MEQSDSSFSMEDIAINTGYPLKGTVKAKVSRNEWKNVLVKVGPNLFKAQRVSGLDKVQFAQRLSVKDMHEPHVVTMSGKLAAKSIQAALSAIEVYNKPDFKYREESFCILMVNAWELLLKAKILHENAENEQILHQRDKEGRVILSASKNPRTISIGEAIKAASLDKILVDHLFILIEFRDNAIHHMNDSPMLKVKVQEVGTATLRNYLEMGKEWFSMDLARYNFYLMPMSFFHPHELQSYSINNESEQHRNLLRYIAMLEEQHPFEELPRVAISLMLKTDFVKSAMRYAPEDPGAIPVKFESEEAFRKKYRWRYKEDLIPAIQKRFSDFKLDQKFFALKKRLESDQRFCGERSLDWYNPKSQKKKFYCPEMLKEFDAYYTKR